MYRLLYNGRHARTFINTLVPNPTSSMHMHRESQQMHVKGDGRKTTLRQVWQLRLWLFTQYCGLKCLNNTTNMLTHVSIVFGSRLAVCKTNRLRIRCLLCPFLLYRSMPTAVSRWALIELVVTKPYAAFTTLLSYRQI